MVSKNLWLIEVAIFASLAFLLGVVCNTLQFSLWIQGGSISIEMVPVFIMAFRWGIKGGLLTGLLLGTLQLVTGGAYVVHWFQAFLDYILAFSLLGFAGIFSIQIKNSMKSGDNKWLSYSIAAMLIASLARLLAHIGSGLIFFSSYAPEGMNSLLYSILYNASFIVPSAIVSCIVTVILIKAMPKKYFTK